MKNKSLIIFSIILAILFISTISFATNDMSNDIKNGIHSVTDTVVDGTANLANDVRSGIQNAENTVENGTRNVGNAVSEGMNDVGDAITDNDGYTATRTTAGDTAGTGIMNSSIWTWIILAVAAVIIVSLVWYYASQHNHIEH